MPRFFVSSEQIENDKIIIIGDDAHHISRSLRMAVGEEILICDMNGTDYRCLLESFSDKEVIARVISCEAVKTEPSFRAHLYQALPKGDKLDMIIQKAVECGVYDITTFDSERCIAKNRSDDEVKLKRRRRIAYEAAKQSGRGRVPCVYPTVSFAEMLTRAASRPTALFCYEGNGTVPLRTLLDKLENSGCVDKNGEISIVIGSEGGFSPAEAEKAISAGLLPTGLGGRILRTETASSFVLSCLVYRFEL